MNKNVQCVANISLFALKSKSENIFLAFHRINNCCDKVTTQLDKETGGINQFGFRRPPKPKLLNIQFTFT